MDARAGESGSGATRTPEGRETHTCFRDRLLIRPDSFRGPSVGLDRQLVCPAALLRPVPVSALGLEPGLLRDKSPVPYLSVRRDTRVWVGEESNRPHAGP